MTTRLLATLASVAVIAACGGSPSAPSNTNTPPSAVTPAPAPTPTPTPPVQTNRVELWGGRDYDVYLGCWSCNSVDAESVFNSVGRYGSRVSPTSISNHVSQYGSAVSPFSACNEVASSPPRLINLATRTFGELTLNQVRPNAIRDRDVVNVLRTVICEQ